MYSILIKNGLIAVLLISLTQSVFAADIKLLDITNDEDSNVSIMGILIDDEIGEVTHIYKKELNKNKEVITYEKFELDQVEAGIVFVKRGKLDIVILRSSNFHAAEGADLELDYLYSGVSGKRKQEPLKVERIGESWRTQMEGKTVEQLHFVSNKSWALGTIGIKGIIKNQTKNEKVAEFKIDNLEPLARPARADALAEIFDTDNL